jgi:predicted GNAT superfamily acetyltransferase
MEGTVVIRAAEAWREFLECEELQRVVWQMSDDRDIVPAHLLKTVAKNGGLLLGAFDAADHMVGFVFGLLGVEMRDGKPLYKHSSHLLAVLPEYRSQGLGYRLKVEQRAQVLKQGLALMTWTYDPLLAVNARLNIARLGAIARRYEINAYGEMMDGLNLGLPSDRLEVEWYLDSPRVRDCLARGEHGSGEAREAARRNVVFQVVFEKGLPRIAAENAWSGEECWVEIPADFNAVKAQDQALALDWRLRVRTVLIRAFDQGYAIADFQRWRAGSESRAGYRLVRHWDGL